MTKEAKSESKNDAETTDKTKKKPYASPKLIEHGSLSDLTKFGGSTLGEDFFGGKKT